MQKFIQSAQIRVFPLLSPDSDLPPEFGSRINPNMKITFFYSNSLLTKINCFMKKFLFLLLGMAVAVSASAGITKSQLQSKVSKQATSKAKVELNAKYTNVLSTAKPIAFRAPAKADVPEGYAQVTLEAHQVWNTDPDNPDYSGYQMLLDADATAYGVEFEEVGGSGTFAGDYANFEYKIPENADNDLNTENIVFDGSVTILIPAGTYDYVMVNPTPGDRLWIASQNGSAGGRGDDFEFKSGCAYHFTITLGSNGNDQTDVEIDDPNAPVVPEIAVTPASTSALVEWAADENATGWNLRYREKSTGMAWTFPLDSYESEMEGWWVYDADEDGNDWGLYYSDDSQTDLCLGSGSYISGVGVCSPDNWLGTPDLPLKGELKFTLWGRSDYYPENLMVYAMIGDELTPLFEEDLLSTVAPVEYTVNLDQFEGAEGCIVFRNYGTYDQWMLYIDNISIGTVNPWIEVNEITNTNYTIDGLTPETTYEVEVMGYNNESESNWCETVEFTTLGESAILLGDVNNDGVVSIADITTLIDYLVGATVESFNEDNANVNGDDTISIGDVAVLVDLILGGE